jgi:ankyrin repeat protein
MNYYTDWWRPTRLEYDYAFSRARAGGTDRLNALMEWQAHEDAKLTLLDRCGAPTRVSHLASEHLSAALARKDMATVKMLMATGLGARAVTLRTRQTALHAAARYGWLAGVECLLKEGVWEPSVADRQGNTPLHSAIQGASSDCVKALLRAGANVNAVNREGRSALHLVAMEQMAFDTRRIVELLVENGVIRSIQDSIGLTAMDWALRMRRYSNIVPLFEYYGL